MFVFCLFVNDGMSKQHGYDVVNITTAAIETKECRQENIDRNIGKKRIK